MNKEKFFNTQDKIKPCFENVRGVRNNNPGNIRKSKFNNWNGEIDGTDPEFCSFLTVRYGIRALVKLITNYVKKRSLYTVSTIIRRYAPSIENHTEHYIKFVCNNLDVGKSEDVSDRIPELVMAIIKFECGGYPYENVELVNKVCKQLNEGV